MELYPHVFIRLHGMHKENLLYFIKILTSGDMLFIPVTVPTVDDIRTSSKLGRTEVYCARSKGGVGGYNSLIFYPHEHFSDL